MVPKKEGSPELQPPDLTPEESRQQGLLGEVESTN
jgi:hypothetical protein